MLLSALSLLIHLLRLLFAESLGDEFAGSLVGLLIAVNLGETDRLVCGGCIGVGIGHLGDGGVDLIALLVLLLLLGALGGVGGGLGEYCRGIVISLLPRATLSGRRLLLDLLADLGELLAWSRLLGLRIGFGHFLGWFFGWFLGLLFGWLLCLVFWCFGRGLLRWLTHLSVALRSPGLRMAFDLTLALNVGA